MKKNNMKKSKFTNTLDNIVINESITKFTQTEKGGFVGSTQEKINEILKKSMPSLEKLLQKIEK